MYSRTELLLGEGATEKLKRARVMVFGIGGVGGYAVEALARAGIGHLTLVDFDTVSESNINRQIIATSSTVGLPKVEAMMQRIVDINPDARVEVIPEFYDEKLGGVLNFSDYDYILDCIDSMKSKTDLILRAHTAGVKIISAMGAGNKLDPTRLRVADITKTTTDPLARKIRYELRHQGVPHHKVVFSDEIPRESVGAVGSMAPVVATMGMIMANEVILDITGTKIK